MMNSKFNISVRDQVYFYIDSYNPLSNDLFKWHYFKVDDC